MKWYPSSGRGTYMWNTSVGRSIYLPWMSKFPEGLEIFLPVLMIAHQLF